MSGGGIREILCEGGGLPNGGTAILEGGVLTLEETMSIIFLQIYYHMINIPS